MQNHQEKATLQTIHKRLTQFALAETTRKNIRAQIALLLDIFDTSDTVPLTRVLKALYPNAGAHAAQGNFRAYKLRFNRTMRHAGIPLELVSTQGTTPPETRHAWFLDLAPEDAAIRAGVSAALELTRRTLAAPASLGGGTPMWEMASITASLPDGAHADENQPAQSAATTPPGLADDIDDPTNPRRGPRAAARLAALNIPRELYAPAAPCASFRTEMEEFYIDHFPREWAELPGRAHRFLTGFSAKLEPIRRISPHPEIPHEAAGFEALAFDQAGRSYSNIDRCARDFGIHPHMWLLGLLYSGLLTIRRIADTLPLMDADIHIDRIFFAMNLDPRMLPGPELRQICTTRRDMFPARFYFEMKETFPLEMAAPARELMDACGFGYALDDVDEADPAVRDAFQSGAAIVKLGYKRSKPLLNMYAASPREMLRELRSYELPGKPLIIEALDEDVRQLFLHHSWKQEWGELLAQGRGLDAGPFYSRHLVPLDSIGIAGGGYVLPPGETDPAATCPIGMPTHHECGYIRTPAADLLLRWSGARPDTEDRIPEHHPPILAILSPPASGKTTLCRTLAAEQLRLHNANHSSPAPALIDTAPAAPKLRAMAQNGDIPTPAQIIAAAAAAAGLRNINPHHILQAARAGRVTLIIDSLDHTTAALPRATTAHLLASTATAAPQQTPARLLLTFRDTAFLDAADEQTLIPPGTESPAQTHHWMPSPLITRLADIDPADIPPYIDARTHHTTPRNRREIQKQLTQWNHDPENPAQQQNQNTPDAQTVQTSSRGNILTHPAALEHLTTLASTAIAPLDKTAALESLINHLLRRDTPRALLRHDITLTHLTRLAKHLASENTTGIHTTRHYRWFQQNPAPALPPNGATPAQIETTESALRTSPLLTRLPSGHLIFISPAIMKHLAQKPGEE